MEPRRAVARLREAVARAGPGPEITVLHDAVQISVSSTSGGATGSGWRGTSAGGGGADAGTGGASALAVRVGASVGVTVAASMRTSWVAPWRRMLPLSV